MAKLVVLALFMMVFLRTGVGASEGVFYREYWAEWDELVSNHPGRLRVNDGELSLHPTYGKRGEAKANGLMLLDVPEDLFQLEGAELYLELWGGHPGTAHKRVMLNGKGTYPIPEVATAQHHCTYSYPAIPLEVKHLVNGVNAFQFACDRGESFWGHFIVDNASVRAYLKPHHPGLRSAGLDSFEATVTGPEPDTPLGDRVEMTLAGSAQEAPFGVVWDTAMVPTQQGPMALRAVVHLAGGFHYLTPVLDGLTFPQDRPAVRLYAPGELPAPFWSRAGRPKTAVIDLPEDLSKVERARLYLKVWDGGEGTVEAPFTINGHPYDVVSGRAVHDVVFTVTDVDLEHLRPGANEFRLLSDTDHHGIEGLLPGPCLVLRLRRHAGSKK